MQVRRVCIVLSAVLLAVNILFLVMYRRTERELTTLSDALVSDAAAYFTSRGCTVSEEVIVRAIPDHAVYTVLDVPLEQTAREAAKRLSLTDSTASVTPVETPDSVICRANKGKEPCVFRLSYDAFGFVYARADSLEGDTKLSDAIMPYFETEDVQLPADLAAEVKRFMKRLLGKQGVGYTVCGVTHDGKTATVCVGQSLGKAPIRSCYACLVAENDHVVTASGHLLFAETGKKYRETLIDGVNALRALDLEKTARVSSERIAYDVRYTDSGSEYLVPVWEIRTEDKNGTKNVFVTDAVRGIM